MIIYKNQKLSDELFLLNDFKLHGRIYDVNGIGIWKGTRGGFFYLDLFEMEYVDQLKRCYLEQKGKELEITIYSDEEILLFKKLVDKTGKFFSLAKSQEKLNEIEKEMNDLVS
jgi:hypothetical protein